MVRTFVGDVLAHPAVAARDAACEHAVLVGERDGQAVDLELAEEVGRLGAFTEESRVPRLEPSSGVNALSRLIIRSRCS